MSHLPEMQQEKEAAGSKEAGRNSLIYEKEMQKMPRSCGFQKATQEEWKQDRITG